MLVLKQKTGSQLIVGDARIGVVRIVHDDETHRPRVDLDLASGGKRLGLELAAGSVLVIGEARVKVQRITQHQQVKWAIDAPPHVRVLRCELEQRGAA